MTTRSKRRRGQRCLSSYTCTDHDYGGSLNTGELHTNTVGHLTHTHTDLRWSLKTHNYGGSLDKQNYDGLIETHNYGGSLNTHNYGGSLNTQNYGGSLETHNYSGSLNTQNYGGSHDTHNYSRSLNTQNYGGSLNTGANGNEWLPFKLLVHGEEQDEVLSNTCHHLAIKFYLYLHQSRCTKNNAHISTQNTAHT